MLWRVVWFWYERLYGPLDAAVRIFQGRHRQTKWADTPTLRSARPSIIMRKEPTPQNESRVGKCRVLLSRMLTQLFLPSCPTCMYCSATSSSSSSPVPVPER